MAEENVEVKQELILNKYADEAALDAGLSELAKQVGVPLGAYQDVEAKKTVYQSLSDIARIKREAAKATPQTALKEAKPVEDESPKDFFAVAGVSATKFFSGEQLNEAELKNIGEAWAKTVSSPKERDLLIDGIRQIGLRAQKSEQAIETMHFRMAASKATGLEDSKIDELLNRRMEVLSGDEEDRAIELMLTKPQSKDVLMLGMKQLFEKAKGKGFFGETATGNTQSTIKGTVHSSASGTEYLTSEEMQALYKKYQAGDRSALTRWNNAKLKK